MQHDVLIDTLRRFPDVLEAAVHGIEPGNAAARSPSGAWSIVEIVAHLADEEIEDFRTRLRSTLEDPQRPWPPIDPEGVAAERRYNERDLAAEVARFREQRTASVAWLDGLHAPDWSRAYEHPSVGPLRAGDLLASWAAHDQLHLRQIAKRRYELVCRAAEPFKTDYAGSWGI